MRSLRMIALLAPLALAACGGGGEDRTIVVNPQPSPSATVLPPGSTVITPSASTTSSTVTRICPPGAITC